MKYSHRVERSIELISQYGGIDGAHHKQWLLNELIKTLADDYDGWVKSYEEGEDGPKTYKWDIGVAP